MVCRLERRVGHLSGWRFKLDVGWSWEHVVHILDVYNGHLITPEQWQVQFASPNAEALGHVVYFHP
jgi:hypothetical protein